MPGRSIRPWLYAGVIALAWLVSGARPVQAQLGGAVAVTSASDGTPEVLVLRPTAERGEAALLVYAPAPGGGWVRTQVLRPADPAPPYEGFSASLAVAPGLAVAAAGDADGTWAGSVYERHGSSWRAVDRVAVTGLEPVDPGPVTMTMGHLMGIMQPPARVLATDPEGRTLAVWRQRPDPGVVRVLSRPGLGDAWELEAELTPGNGAGFGPVVSLAADADRIVVGAPGGGGGGSVFVFARGGSGEWALEARLADSTLTAGASLGTAVALEADRLAAGAPGVDAVLTFRHTDEGWLRDAGVPADPRWEGSGFGRSVALDDGVLWVGAPLAAEARGAVMRYRWGADGWSPAGDPIRGLSAGSALGWALGVSGDVAAIGEPGAGSGIGGVALIRRSATGWGEAVRITDVTLPGTVADGREVPCAGDAAGFDCRGVDLLAFLTLESLGAAPGERVSDTWGWTDPETGREYALVGRTAGMAIVDVTRPSSPTLVGLVPANPSGARDIKTFDHHAFFTGDGAGDHGLVVFDLRRLRGPPPADGTFEPDARYTGIGSAHNLILDAETGLAIPVGASGGGTTCGGGFHMVDVTTPLEPSFLGCYTDDIGLIAPGRSHDGQCVVYRGPDVRYRGRQVCFASNETALRILDVTRPEAVEEVAMASYPGVAYTHQGWLTEDHRYFFMNDELDELVGLTDRTRTLVWDVAELDDPVLVAEHLGPDNATDHNLFIRGDRMYQANYHAGMRVLDISDPLAPVEVGYFDTTPYDGNPPGFGSGAWTAYPFLESGTVVVTSMNEGLFLLRPRPVVP